MIVISQNLVLSAIDELSADNPVILWDNLVTTTNVASTTEDADFPITNVANPATHLKWVGGVNTGDEYITITTNSVEQIDGIGIARHNFGSAHIPISIEGATIDSTQKILLHFDGAGGSTTYTDSNSGGSAHVWTASGGAVLDGSAAKFGPTSGAFDGVDDYVTTPDHVDFALGSSDFTADVQFRTASVGVHRYMLGQVDATGTASLSSFSLALTTAAKVEAKVYVGSTTYTVLGTSTIATGAFHQAKLIRTGNILRLFVDGVQEGGDVAITGSVNNSAATFGVGRAGSFATGVWHGWLDEFRLLVGRADETAAFTPPAAAYDNLYWVELVSDRILADNAPVMFRFTPQALTSIRIRLQQGDDVPEAAVIYVGPLLVLERSIKIDTPHTPFPMGIVSEEVNGKSESGNFLGRIEINRFVESTADFEWFQPVWFRANMVPFLSARPSFFFAWNPTEYPDEVGYAWLMSNPRPDVDPVTRRIALQLKMQGVV